LIQCRAAYDGDVLGSVGKGALTVVLLVAAIGPVIAVAWFSWWFLRAGRRYDELERAAGRRPPPPY
jgi:hypothetical protein